MKRIEQWSVISTSRLAGEVYNRASHLDGQTVVTSPVVEIRMLGGDGWHSAYPVAFTESGSAYRLGRPSASIPMEDAQTFIYERLRAGGVPVTRPRDRHFRPESTIVRAVLDANLQHVERIELDATSFQPL